MSSQDSATHKNPQDSATQKNLQTYYASKNIRVSPRRNSVALLERTIKDFFEERGVPIRNEKELEDARIATEALMTLMEGRRRSTRSSSRLRR